MKKTSQLILNFRYQFQKYKLIFFLNFILFLILMLALNLNIFEVSYHFKEGDIAPFTVIAAKDLEYVDTLETEDRKKDELKKIIPVFDLDMTIYENKLKIIEEVVGIVNNQTYNEEEKTDKLSNLLSSFLKDKKIEEFDFKEFLKQSKRKIFFEKIRSILYDYYQNGIYRPVKGEYDLAAFSKKLVPVRIIQENSTVRDFRNFSNFIYMDISYFEFLAEIKKRLGKTQNLNIMADFLFILLEDNLYINAFYTEQEVNTRLQRISPVVKKISEDQVIVRKGDKINLEILDQVRALKVAQKKNVAKKFVFSFILALFFLSVLNIILRISFVELYKDIKKMALIFIFIIFNVLTAYLFFNLLASVSFPLGILFPIGFTVYTVSIIINRESAFFLTITAVLIYLVFLVIYRTDGIFSLLYLFAAGNLINFFVANILQRDQIIRSSIYSIFPYVLLTAVYVFYFQNYVESSDVGLAFLWSALNPVISAVVSIGIIPIFEKVFNMITPFRLMELSNLSNRVLGDMHLLAPGTYHHSMMVSYLVEAACKEIKANYLLGRVGALYHDIGKLSNPNYFAENIQFNQNIHEDITPQMSASILKRHVLEGIKKAKEMKLPDEIMRFVSEHHGTSVMEFFYQKAKENTKESDQVDISSFKYGGPKPQSKETAILMLADGIEAGVRSLKSKRYDLIEEKISQVILSRIISGELSESLLTMKEIRKIELVFQKLMYAYYHVRPSYPEDEKNKEEDSKDV